MSDTLDDRLGIGGNMPPEPTLEERLREIDPTALVVLPATEIAALVAVQFPDLHSRSSEFVERIAAWLKDHDGGAIPIADDAENNDLSDWMVQLRDFVAEVDEARKTVKDPVFQAGRAIDSAFAALADPIVRALGPSRHATLGTMQFAQDIFLRAKAEAARREAERIAAEAAAEAWRKAEEARRLAEEEAARTRALQQQAGLDAQTAAEVSATLTDRAVAEAEDAAATAEAAQQAAAASTQDFARTRSPIGTTSGLRGEWDATVTSIKELCRAVVEGDAPETFVTVDMTAIRQAIRRKVNPVRKCPGLSIEQTFSARRSGSR